MASSKTTDASELFLSRLSEIYTCHPGDNVLLECYVRHQNVKSILWYANGELVDIKGFRIWHRYQKRTGQCTLYIRSVLYSDEGSYCCEATSLDNHVQTLEIKLKVDNYDKSWTTIPVLHMAGHLMPEDDDELNALFLTSNNRKSIEKETMFPISWYELRIDRPLLDPTISIENTSLQLSFRIAGLHIDKFEWYRNGELIAVCNEASPASVTSTIVTDDIDHGLFQASYDTLPAHFIALLTVERTRKQHHEGKYECHASNAHFHVSSSCEVIIQQDPLSMDEIISSPLKTEITRRIEYDQDDDIFSTEPKRLRLDDSELQSSQLLTTSPVQSPFRLVGDQKVPSIETKKETSKSVTWNDKIETFEKNDSPNEDNNLLPPIIERTAASSSDESSSASAGDLEQILRSHSLLTAQTADLHFDTSSGSEAGNDPIGMCPVFFQLLPSTIQCEEGERLLLSCQVMAGIQCQIKWSINGTIISEYASRTRRHYNPDNGICFIIIEPTLTTDTGIYRLTISNRYGQAQSTCQAEITARQLPLMPDDNLLTNLYFVQLLPSTPILCHDGDTIQLTCIVYGRRPIQIRWYKDDQQILNNEKRQHTRQIYFDPLTGKSTLTIHDIYPNDSGIYRCEATNEHGKESTNVTVDVTHYQYEVDSEISSASMLSGPPSDHEDNNESQIQLSRNNNVLYEESRRIADELNARIADLSSGYITTIKDQTIKQQGTVYYLI